MPKFFVVSDLHSFLEPTKRALEQAGFDPDNDSHWLISCGDAFDRGPDSKALLEFLMSLKRKILIKGNHDILLKICCKNKNAGLHDIRNGTVRTIEDLGGADSGLPFYECCTNTLKELSEYHKLLINYFETENYIFVHSWVPTVIAYDKSASKPWYMVGKEQYFREDWRNADSADWEEAMWGNPFMLAYDGLNQTGKTIVFGHWHCSTGHDLNSPEASITSEFGENAIWESYHNEEQGIIGIDRCTAYTGEVNVLVLEDNFLES